MKYYQALTEAIGLMMGAFADRVRTGPRHEPAYTHSLSVAMALVKYECDVETVVAGVLHDTKEDTEVSLDDIEGKFGPVVRMIVDACSYDEKIGDNQMGEDDILRRVIQLAQEGETRPLLIKVVDSGDNLKTCRHLKPEFQERMVFCGTRWLEQGKKYLPGHLAVEDLSIVLERERKRLGM